MGKKKGGNKKTATVLSLDDFQVPSTELPTAPSLSTGPSGDLKGGQSGKADREGGWGRNSEIRSRDGPGGRYREDVKGRTSRENFNPSMADSESDWRRGGSGGFPDSMSGDKVDWKRGDRLGPEGSGISDFDNDWRSNPKELPPAPSPSGNRPRGNNRRFGQDEQLRRDTNEDDFDWKKRATTMPPAPNDKIQRNINGNQGQRQGNFKYFQNKSEEEPNWSVRAQVLPTNNEDKSSDSNSNSHKRTNTNIPFGEKVGSSDEVSQWRGSGQPLPPVPQKSDGVRNWRSGNNRKEHQEIHRDGPNRGRSFHKEGFNKEGFNKDGNWRSRRKDTTDNEEDKWHTHKKGGNRYGDMNDKIKINQLEDNIQNLNINPNSPKSTESISTTSTASMSEAPTTPQPTPEPLISNEKVNLSHTTSLSGDPEKKNDKTNEIEIETTITNEGQSNDQQHKKKIDSVEESPKKLSAKEEKALAKKLEKERKQKELEEKKAREAAEVATKLAMYEQQKQKVSKLFSEDLKGIALIEALERQKGEFKEEPIVKNSFILEYLLKEVLDESSVSTCEWMDESAYGGLLSALLSNDVDKLRALFAIQSYCHSLNFPRLPTNVPLITTLFQALYEKNFMEGEIFVDLWKEDEKEDNGKRKALIQTTAWLLEVEQDLDQEEG